MDEREHLYNFQMYKDDVAQGDYKYIAGSRASMSYDDYTPSIHFSINVAPDYTPSVNIGG